MNICPECGKKFIRNDYYERHLKTHQFQEEPTQEEPKEAPQEVQPEAVEVKEVQPEAVVETTPPVPEEITLNFKRPIEVTINGVHFIGRVVMAPNMETASEVVRIAREAYGDDILES